MKGKILFIDNFDSFVYNLVQFIGEIAEDKYELLVYRNNQITLDEIKKLSPDFIVISPGPGSPDKAGISAEVIRHFYKTTPILGVCLGHQAIGYAFGAKIVHAPQPKHGKISRIYHRGGTLFHGVKNPFNATRYHSLVIQKESLPQEFKITAVSMDDNQIMAIEHNEYPLFGVQFHPESVMTEFGKEILKNFLNIRRGPMVSVEKPLSIVESIKKISNFENLEPPEAAESLREIMEGKAEASQIAAFLIGMRMKGETGTELGAMAQVMKEKAINIKKPSDITVDTCGTGGDGMGTFNISTATAFVVASAGIPVAKHGNRSVSSKCGSADVLEALGYSLETTPEQMEKYLEKVGIAFLFAPKLHPAMKYATPVRRQLKIRTFFNILGPITNPAGVKIQLVGVYSPEIMEKVAQALMALGVEKAWVVHSCGTDEITPCGSTKVIEINEGSVKKLMLNPEALGISLYPMESLRAKNSLHENAALFKKVLSGEGPEALTTAVAMNAAAVFYLTNKANTYKEGFEYAYELIKAGKPSEKLEEFLKFKP